MLDYFNFNLSYELMLKIAGKVGYVVGAVSIIHRKGFAKGEG